MRESFFRVLLDMAERHEDIYLLTADMGFKLFDSFRERYPDRFLNVGIAEANMIGIAAGLSLSGKNVYCYSIIPFLIMRAYEQIRINLSLLSQLRTMNVNLIGVGAGLSYDVSGPTHHCLEDIALMRALPNIAVLSPSDWIMSRRFAAYSVRTNGPKYIRLDGKPLPSIYHNTKGVRIGDGFHEIQRGRETCLVSTGYMTHRAIEVARALARDDIARTFQVNLQTRTCLPNQACRARPR